MRIRKRQVPLPLSSLSPIPLFLAGYEREKAIEEEVGNACASEELRGVTGERRRSNDSRAPDIPRNAPETSSSAVVSASTSENEGTTGGKKRGRERSGGISGSNIGGSRCSRVNGRGWRCGKHTLTGYSLCEHHLGKGRLRSMSMSVHGVVQASRKGNEKPQQVQQPSGTDDACLLNNNKEGEEEYGDSRRM